MTLAVSFLGSGLQIFDEKNNIKSLLFKFNFVKENLNF
jgi:hypothetical protein